MSEDIKIQANQACEAGENFVKLYYETLDQRRHHVCKLYLDAATLSWNGHQSTGSDAILKFLLNLPTSNHTVDCIDAQPLNSTVTQGQTSILVTASGSVKYQGNDMKMFTQNFMLTTHNNSWKVVSDCIRTFE